MLAKLLMLAALVLASCLLSIRLSNILTCERDLALLKGLACLNSSFVKL